MMRRLLLFLIASLFLASTVHAGGEIYGPASSSYPGVTSDGSNGLNVTGSVAMPTPVLAGTSTYVCGATATSVTVDLSAATCHLVTLPNTSGVSLVFTGLPTLTNQRVVYQLDLIQPATGATVNPVWTGDTAHKNGTTPVTTAQNGARDSFSLVYGTDGTTLVIYPSGMDMR